MNRKQKIIVSVTGIILVFLILVGLTYAYFLTKINGNTNDKSISVTTANLEIEYKDNNDIITGDKIEPGTILPTKVFTVINNGNMNVEYSVGLVNIINTFTNTEDVVYTITCKSYNKEGFSLGTDGTITGTENGSCSGVDETEFPTLNSYIVTNNIDVNIVHAYTMTVTYKETGTDQSIDMNKKLSAKIDIFDPESLTIQGSVTNSSENDYVVIHSKEQESQILNGSYKFIGITPDKHTITIKNRKTTDTKSTSLDVEKGAPSISGSKIIYDEDKNVAAVDINKNETKLDLNINNLEEYNPYKKDTLANAIYKKTKNPINSNDTIFKNQPLTKPGELVDENEKVLSKTFDDYGDTYYYRGNVIDNYINFAGMCWRIVRISGDSSIKIVLDNQNNTCDKANNEKDWNIGNSNFGYDATKYLISSNGTEYKKLMNYVDPVTDKENAMVNRLENFQNDKLKNYLDYLKYGDWCYDIGELNRLSKEDYEFIFGMYAEDDILTFPYNNSGYIDSRYNKCDGNILKNYSDNVEMYVGILTLGEVIYAGSTTMPNIPSDYISYYLGDENKHINSWWTFTPMGYGSNFRDNIFRIFTIGGWSDTSVDSELAVRPAINLKANILINSGDGTSSNPYTVKLS